MDNKEKKPNKYKILVIVIIAFIVLVFLATQSTGISPKTTYHKACNNLESGNYEEAITLFEELGDYEDSVAKSEEAHFLNVKEKINSGEYVAVCDIYKYGDATKNSDGITLDSCDLLNDNQLKEFNKLLDATSYMVYGNINIIGDGHPFSHENDSYYASFDREGTTWISYHDNSFDIPPVDFYWGINDIKERYELCWAVCFMGDVICKNIEILKKDSTKNEYSHHMSYTFKLDNDKRCTWQSSNDSSMYLMSMEFWK